MVIFVLDCRGTSFFQLYSRGDIPTLAFIQGNDFSTCNLSSPKFSTLCATLTYVSFQSTQVAHTTHTLSLSSHYSVVPILFPTPLFPSLYICGTVLMVLYVLSPPLYHLNITLLIFILTGIMSCISSTLLFTCLPADSKIWEMPFYLGFAF